MMTFHLFKKFFKIPLVGLLLLGFHTQAKVFKWKIPPQKPIHLHFSEVHIIVRVNPASNELKMSLDESHLVSTPHIDVQNTNRYMSFSIRKKSFLPQFFRKQDLSQRDSLISLVIAIPQRPLRLQLRKGVVEFNYSQGRSFVHPLKILQMEGSIKLSGLKAPSKIFLHKGVLNVLRHRAELDIESYSATTQIQEMQGGLKLLNFLGFMELENIKGRVFLKSHKGELRLNSLVGNIKVVSQKSPIKAHGVKGFFELKTQSSKVDLSLGGKTRVVMRGKDSQIGIRTKGRAAKVTIETKKARVRLPTVLSKKRNREWKTYKSQVEGEGPDSAIYIKNESGRVSIY